MKSNLKNSYEDAIGGGITFWEKSNKRYYISMPTEGYEVSYSVEEVENLASNACCDRAELIAILLAYVNFAKNIDSSNRNESHTLSKAFMRSLFDILPNLWSRFDDDLLWRCKSLSWTELKELVESDSPEEYLVERT